jgi:hypothetical protein
MARASLHQQVVIKTEKDLMRLKEILSQKNQIPDTLPSDIKFATDKEMDAVLRKWGAQQ